MHAVPHRPIASTATAAAYLPAASAAMRTIIVIQEAGSSARLQMIVL